MYIDYFTYRNLGGSITCEAAFKTKEWEARKKLDFYTFDRIKNMKCVPKDVKFGMVKIIEFIKNADDRILETQKSTAVTSYSNDGVSVSYASRQTVEEIKAETEKEIKDFIFTELSEYVVRGGYFV